MHGARCACNLARTCSTSELAVVALACSDRLWSVNAPNFCRRLSRSPMRGCAAKASSQHVTGTCAGVYPPQNAVSGAPCLLHELEG